MSLIDWIITIVPVAFVMGLGWHVRKYIIWSIGLSGRRPGLSEICPYNLQYGECAGS